MLTHVSPQEGQALTVPQVVVHEPVSAPAVSPPSAESNLAVCARRALALGAVSAIGFFALLGIMFAIMDTALVVAVPIMLTASLIIAACCGVALKR
jgi:hypothetical protein